MRVRYQLAGDECYTAECDLTEKAARKRYEDCKKNGICIWAELVSEEDGNYMEIIESFENRDALRIFEIMNELKAAI